MMGESSKRTDTEKGAVTYEQYATRVDIGVWIVEVGQIRQPDSIYRQC